MEKIFGMFDQFPDLMTEDKIAFTDKLELITLEKGKLFEQEGKVCSYLYFVRSGSARSFYVKDNKDITVSFTLEGEFTTAMHSFISRKPSYENIEVMEKSVIARISHESLLNLFENHHGLERTYRLILEQYYIMLEEQLIFVKFKSAMDRYLDLMENRPKIIHKASVGQIASYLDMSIETLSRIRSKI
ncbi:Crp/Fnr family transcriptional regulator [Algoriphagus jejuensis]|uniref:Crp/Fnr family transcriptional regulator n=1 Tax=Algoriphagus jejuensis TaxID=419934 RepID=A0ABP3YGI5_9BACT